MKDKLNQEQINAIRCAFADLIGALQAYEQGNSNIHDWESHKLTIEELESAFPFIKE